MKRSRANGLSWRRRLAVAGLVGGVVLSGCQSKPPPKPHIEVPRGYLNTMPGNATGPGTAQPPLPALVSEILAAHGFPPPRALEGSESSVWAVSARPRSAAEVTLAVIRMTSKGEVTVEMVGCAKVGNAWPVLGELFQEPMIKEAKQMEKEIQDRFRGSPP